MWLNDRFFSAFGGPAGATLARVRRGGSGGRLLDIADFRRLWLIGLVVFAVRWLEMLAVGVFVYQHTGSAFAVALMTLLRTLPMALFGAPIGALAERVERRRAQIAVSVTLLATAFALAGLAWLGRLAVWHIAVAGFVSGIAGAADNPVRRVMIGEVVGPERMGAAMAVDVGANNASRMLGPTIGGLVLAGSGIAGAFSVSVLCYLVALVAALRLRHRNATAPGNAGTMLARTLEGLMAARRDRRLVGILTITIVYNLFGWPFTSMIPVIGLDNLHLGASGIGVLASMDGIGSFAGAIAIALFARPVHYRRLYIGGVAVYLVMLIAFALVPVTVVAGAALLATGLSNAAFSVMQATLIYLAAPADMRSRMYGVLSVCIGVSPLGFLGLGLLAEAIGAPWATTATGVAGLAALMLSRSLWRGLGSVA